MDPQLIDWAAKLGPAGIFALMWYLERTERLKIADQLLKNLENIGKMNDAWLKVLGSRSGGES